MSPDLATVKAIAPEGDLPDLEALEFDDRADFAEEGLLEERRSAEISWQGRSW